jgi:2-haloalkanoic acid dehalogenase type II
MLSPAGVLLDFYGTLVFEDDDIVSTIYDAIARRSTGPQTASDIGRLWGNGFQALCQRSFGNTFITQKDIGLQALGQVIKTLNVDLDAEALFASQFGRWTVPPLFDDALPFLQHLDALRVPVCIVSNIDREDIEGAIAFHRLPLSRIVTSEDVRAYKPRAEVFQAGLDLLGLTRHQVLHVGDSRSSDLAGARAMGIPVAWVNRSTKTLSTDDPLPDIIVSNLAELGELLVRGKERTGAAS